MKFAALILGAMLTVACGGQDYGTTSPTPQPTPLPAPAPAPVPTTISLTGTVKTATGLGINAASVRILDGTNVGKSTSTNTTGQFTLTGLVPANANISALATGYNEQRLGLFVDGVVTLAFVLNPAPAPTPTPTPSPSPAPVAAGFYVWGHDQSAASGTYTQYLGFFTCMFCQEFSSDSINNEFGRYGSAFSSTSIHNEFGMWGSAFSGVSACNTVANTPPRVFNSNLSVYYGELTLNQFRSGAIKTSSTVNWLAQYICHH